VNGKKPNLKALSDFGNVGKDLMLGLLRFVDGLPYVEAASGVVLLVPGVRWRVQD
jgi:hypothetical protein